MSNQDFPRFSLEKSDDPLVKYLYIIIRYAVKVLAVIMVMVILWGVADICWVIYKRLLIPPYFLLKMSDILATFGAAIAVLIAIEIFINVVLYLHEDIIHVKLVLATALMAIARKVIVFDFKELQPHYVYATGFVVLALGITYWLICRQGTD
jgi:uncharacterized membrane protein (DUF373 family)